VFIVFFECLVVSGRIESLANRVRLACVWTVQLIQDRVVVRG
jgi:hypothetical protein